MRSQRPDIKTYYATLGLEPGATQEEIKKAYEKKKQELANAYTAAFLHAQAQRPSSQTVVMQTLQVEQPTSSSKQPESSIDGLDKFLDGLAKNPSYDIYQNPFHTDFSLLHALDKFLDRILKDSRFRANLRDRHVEQFFNHFNAPTTRNVFYDGEDASLTLQSKFKKVDENFNLVKRNLSGQSGALFETLLARIQFHCPDVSQKDNDSQISHILDYRSSYRF